MRNCPEEASFSCRRLLLLCVCAQILGTVPRSALIAAPINGRLWFPPLMVCLGSGGSTTLVLNMWEGSVEVGREEAGVVSLQRGHLKAFLGPGAMELDESSHGS